MGAGSTGLCFTDSKRCESELGIPVPGFRTHQPSSDFFHRVVRAMAGARYFNSDVYVQAICPLDFIMAGLKGSLMNLNYYDDHALQEAISNCFWEVGRFVFSASQGGNAPIGGRSVRVDQRWMAQEDFGVARSINLRWHHSSPLFFSDESRLYAPFTTSGRFRSSAPVSTSSKKPYSLAPVVTGTMV